MLFEQEFESMLRQYRSCIEDKKKFQYLLMVKLTKELEICSKNRKIKITTQIDNNELIKDELEEITRLLYKPEYIVLLENRSREEAIILFLYLYGIDGKYVSTNKIAKILNLESQKVRDIIKGYLFKERQQIVSLVMQGKERQKIKK